MRLEQKQIRVSASLAGVDCVDLVATVHCPDGEIVERGTVLICWPGGSYTRQYWDFPAETYNFSEHMAARGHLVICVDPLGVGESTRPLKGDEVGLEIMSTVADAFTQQIRATLADGTFDEHLKPLPDVRLVGVGHSMGAIGVTVQQGLFGSYDAVVILGNAVQFRDLSADGDTSAMGVAELMESLPAEHVKSGTVVGTWNDEYVMLDRAIMSGSFYLSDVPAEIIDKDTSMAARWPRRPIVEAAAGYTGRYAPKVEVPLFLGLGAIDLTATPRAEVQSYPGCSDITLFVMANSAHCHNFSTDRQLLWNRIDRWL